MMRVGWRPRAARDLKAAALGASALSRDWSKPELRALARNADLVDVPAGYTLFQLGDRVVACYLLVEGMLAETRGDDAWLVDAPGAMVGAAESFVGAVASSTVTAVTPTLVLALPTRALLGGVERSRPLRTATFVELARRALPPARRHAAGRHLDPADT